VLHAESRRLDIHSREESPAFNAQLRKTIRENKTTRPTARPSQNYAQILRSQLERQSSTQTQDLDAPYLFPNIPNSGRKRKAAVFYQPPKTRSQAKSQLAPKEDTVEGRRPRKVIILKLPQGTAPVSRAVGQTPSSHLSRAPRVTKNPRFRQRDVRGRFLPKKTVITPGPNVSQIGAVKSRDIQQLEQLKSFLVPKN
jgi:hypothetical protein